MICKGELPMRRQRGRGLIEQIEPVLEAVLEQREERLAMQALVGERPPSRARLEPVTSAFVENW